MDEKAYFCRSLEWKDKISWYDLTGIRNYGNGIIAKIEFSTLGTVGTYPGFLVTIIDKQIGIVDSKFFEFDDYLDSKSNRADARKDYPDGRGCCFHVWTQNKTDWKWYIAIPKTTRPFCEAIEAYISNFE